MSFEAAHSGVSRWSRFLGAGAVVTVIVLLGSTAMAPYSVSPALASGGDADAAPAEEQRLATTSVNATIINTEITAVDTAGSQAGAAKASKKPPGSESSPTLYSLEQFMFTGSVNWGGYKFTFYSQQVLPGPGLEIPGRHVSDAGYVSDEDGYIVLAGSAPKGTVYETPFGAPGKIYDRGTVGNHLDVYIR